MAENANLPQPDPALRRLDRLVGRWSMEGNLVGSDAKNIKGEATFRWRPGGFFLEQHVQLDFMGCSRTCHRPLCPTDGRSRATP
jgi:hypothetical protein